MIRRLIWPLLAVAMITPLILAAQSPQLQWRSGIYIAAGFAGILALALLVVHPLLPARVLPVLSPRRGRQLHRWFGPLIVAAVVVHVVALWLTSPPDVVDALTFSSPTPFSLWGVIAMWALFATGVLAGLRRRMSVWVWRYAHKALAVIIVAGTAAHALLIDGTMELFSKWMLCALACATTAIALRR